MKIHGPISSVKILGVKLSGVCDDILLSLKNELLHLSQPTMQK